MQNLSAEIFLSTLERFCRIPATIKPQVISKTQIMVKITIQLLILIIVAKQTKHKTRIVDINAKIRSIIMYLREYRK